MAGESPRAEGEKGASSRSVRLPLHRLNSTASGSSDRFIPERGSMDLDMARMVLNDNTNNDKENSSTPDSPSTLAYKKHLSATMFSESNSTLQGTENNKPRILAFQSKPPSATQTAFMNTLYSHSVSAPPQKSSRTHRYIPQGPERTLDAPELVDDYYLNLLDWGANNVLCIALGDTVYKWDARTSLISELMTAEESEGPITSVSWAPDGRHIAVGLNNSVVQIWDSECNRQLRALRGHTARVGSLAWNSSIITSGGLDAKIFNHDVRIRDHIVDKYEGHEQEVCGLKWSTSGQQLSSGGNDNLLHVWDRRMSSNAHTNATQQQYLHRLVGHQGAVKAMAWCPFQSNVLASGGGTSDRCIKFWNTHTGACLNSMDTGSQVCGLLWNKHERELLSSHGYSQNQLTLWKYPAMVKIAELTGHTSRVLHLAESPDGYTVASAAGDETLRFWQPFGTADAVKRTKSSSSKDENGGFNKYLTHIR